MTRHFSPLVVVLVALAVLLVEVAQGFAQGMPERFYLAEEVQTSFRTAWKSSDTFRRQCARIAAAGVIVSIKVENPLLMGPRMLARSVIVRERGRVGFVRIALRTDADWVRELAHELEHVIEQLDGINLPALSVTRRREVWRVGGTAFETQRARDAAVAVKREVDAAGGAARRRPLIATAALTSLVATP